MTPSAFVDVVRLVEERLCDLAPVADRVDRNRLRILPQDVSTAAVVRLARSVPSLAEIMGGAIDWQTSFSIECYARADTEEDSDVAVDPVLRAVYGRLASDPSLGGAVMGLEARGIEWEFATTGENLACATLTFIALHQTAAHNLESPES